MEISYKAVVEIRRTQRELLDLLEEELSGLSCWPIIRAKALEVFEIEKVQFDFLNLLEVALCHSSSWPKVRAKVLEILGRKGLQRGGQ